MALRGRGKKPDSIIILNWASSRRSVIVIIQQSEKRNSFFCVQIQDQLAAAMINWHRMFMTSTFQQDLFDAFTIASGVF